jgi:hypothetical protein
MAFRDCLLSAVEQGAITRDEADRLQQAFDDEFAQARLALGDDAAGAAARANLETQLRAEAIETRRRVLLQESAQSRIGGYLQSFRDIKGKADVFGAVLNLIEHHGFAGTSSVAGRVKAIVSLAHGELADVLAAFRRSRITGARFNRPLFDDVVRETLGQSTGSAEAKTFADAIGGVFESLRQRFNAAGGAIGKLEGGYLPQAHDARAMLAAGRDGWKEFIRPRLDLERMRDPLTGERLTPARLEQSLDAAFDAVTTDGWSKRMPAARPFGTGALAGQRAEERFLHFKDAESWLAYNEAFGAGDPVKSVFQHINGMARDIASMEILGPNPNATVEWLKQIVQSEAAKAVAGKPTLYAGAAGGAADKLDYLPWRIDSVYQYVRGRQVVSQQLATGMGNTRNLLTSAFLGSASILAATTDPFIDMAARHLSGMPVTKAIGGILHAFTGAAKKDVVRSGIVWDDFLHITGDEARYAGTLGGSEWSRWLADRTVNLSGLEPITQARKHVFARDFEAMMADHAGKNFDELPPYIKRTMEGYGLDRTAWDVMRSTDLFEPGGGSGFLRPIDVAKLHEGPALPKVQQLLGIDAADAAKAAEQTAAGVRQIAEQYVEMILGQTERAVPTGTARARSMVTGTAPRGSIFGELLESGLMFKSFSLSFTALQLQAIQQELKVGVARGAAYAGGLFAGVTLGGALAMQIKSVLNGKDPQPMNTPQFWMQAMLTGGGLGILGDFMFADVNRLGQSVGATVAGPVVGAANDVLRFTVGNAREALAGQKTHIGREAVNLAGRYVPVVSSLWQTRAAYRRIVLDQLQYLVDPEAHRNFREQEQRLKRETGQGFFWPPGKGSPTRPPQLAR